MPGLSYILAISRVVVTVLCPASVLLRLYDLQYLRGIYIFHATGWFDGVHVCVNVNLSLQNWFWLKLILKWSDLCV
jgi:hypothetical protein